MDRLRAEPFSNTLAFPRLAPRLQTPVVLDLQPVQWISMKDRYDTPFVFDKQLVSVASKIKVPTGQNCLALDTCCSMLRSWPICELC